MAPSHHEYAHYRRVQNDCNFNRDGSFGAFIFFVMAVILTFTMLRQRINRCSTCNEVGHTFRHCPNCTTAVASAVLSSDVAAIGVGNVGYPATTGFPVSHPSTTAAAVRVPATVGSVVRPSTAAHATVPADIIAVVGDTASVRIASQGPIGRQRRCSNCHTAGHDIRSCIAPGGAHAPVTVAPSSVPFPAITSAAVGVENGFRKSPCQFSFASARTTEIRACG